MTQELIALVGQYGLLLIFISVLVEQIGIPVPSMPILIVAGALSAAGQLPWIGIIPVALVGCLLPDLIWYWAGRRFGARVIRTLCRVSLSPDSCIHRSELQFQRWRGWSLLVAKFVPGLSVVAPPLVGALGLRLRAFVMLDGLGSLLWIGFSIGLGYAFSGQIAGLLDKADDIGTLVLEIVAALIVLYIAVKWWRRRQAQIALRMKRFTVAELHRAVSRGRAPLILDVRSPVARELDPRAIPGALLADTDDLLNSLRGVPFGREIVSYCNCPNEATAAKVAKSLIAAGYCHARPLLGGLDAWEQAGFPVQRLPEIVEPWPNAQAHAHE